MGDELEPCFLCHLCYPENAADSSDVADIRLDDIKSPGFDHPLPLCQVTVLLPTGHVQSEGLGDLGRPLEVPIRTGFLEMADAILFKHFSDLDGLVDGVAAIGIRQQPHLIF